MTETEPLPIVAPPAPDSGALPAGSPPADPFALHLLDLDAVHRGVWVDVRGDEFLIARMGNERWPAMVREWKARHQLPEDADVPADKHKLFSAFAFSRAVLLDVRLKATPGAPYTFELGERIATDPRLDDTYAKLLAVANGDFSIAAIREQVLLGNLKPFSSGCASTAASSTP